MKEIATSPREIAGQAWPCPRTLARWCKQNVPRDRLRKGPRARGRPQVPNEKGRQQRHRP